MKTYQDVLLILFTCAGVRSQFFATSKTSGWESSSPFPKEEYA